MCVRVKEEEDVVVSFFFFCGGGRLIAAFFVRQPFIPRRSATAVKKGAAPFISGPARVLLQHQLGAK